MTTKQFKVALLFFTAFIVWAILSATFRWPNPFKIIVDVLPFGDKVGHFLLMGMLAFLANMALQMRTMRLFGRNILLGSIIVLVLVTAEELSQGFVPTRTLSATDLAADFLGIWCFGRIAEFVSARQELV